jgi:hypothetical protein
MTLLTWSGSAKKASEFESDAQFLAGNHHRHRAVTARNRRDARRRAGPAPAPPWARGVPSAGVAALMVVLEHPALAELSRACRVSAG